MKKIDKNRNENIRANYNCVFIIPINTQNEIENINFI